ncbi:MAG: hypothetical protein JSW55_19405 [Chloroflexota bacterium]|nr:MAG: hypothetical protein JSW55_19405 [Chloroflexota bacterium]
MGLVARALEMEGIATAVVGWNGGRMRMVSVPRMVITRLSRGVAFGRPGDKAQQYRVLEATLALLEVDAPLEPLYLDEAM